MKLHWMLTACMTLILISGCASTGSSSNNTSTSTANSSNSQTPDLSSYQTRTMPTGGSDAALAAHKTY